MTPLQAGADPAHNPEALGTFSELQADVSEWADRTFTKGTIYTNLDHLTDKVDELAVAIGMTGVGTNTTHVRDGGFGTAEVERKIASIQLLLMHLASRFGINLHEAALVKHGLDRASDFGPEDGKSYWTRQ